MSLILHLKITIVICIIAIIVEINAAPGYCGPRNYCEVQSWSNWSACNATCGVTGRHVLGVTRREKYFCCDTHLYSTMTQCLGGCNITMKWWQTNSIQIRTCGHCKHGGTFNSSLNLCECRSGYGGPCCDVKTTSNSTTQELTTTNIATATTNPQVINTKVVTAASKSFITLTKLYTNHQTTKSVTIATKPNKPVPTATKPVIITTKPIPTPPYCSPRNYCEIQNWSIWSKCNATCGVAGVIRREKYFCCDFLRYKTLAQCLGGCNITMQWWQTNSVEVKSCGLCQNNGTFDSTQKVCICQHSYGGQCCDVAAYPKLTLHKLLTTTFALTNSLKSTTKLVTTTIKLVTTTTNLAATTTKSVVTKTKPVVTTTKPVTIATKPVTRTTKTTQPVTNATKLVMTTTKPVTSSTNPVTTATKPITKAIKQVTTDIKLLTQTNKPVLTGNKPFTSTTKLIIKPIKAVTRAIINITAMKTWAIVLIVLLILTVVASCSVCCWCVLISGDRKRKKNEVRPYKEMEGRTVSSSCLQCLSQLKNYQFPRFKQRMQA